MSRDISGLQAKFVFIVIEAAVQQGFVVTPSRGRKGVGHRQFFAHAEAPKKQHRLCLADAGNTTQMESNNVLYLSEGP